MGLIIQIPVNSQRGQPTRVCPFIQFGHCVFAWPCAVLGPGGGDASNKAVRWKVHGLCDGPCAFGAGGPVAGPSMREGVAGDEPREQSGQGDAGGVQAEVPVVSLTLGFFLLSRIQEGLTEFSPQTPSAGTSSFQ